MEGGLTSRYTIYVPAYVAEGTRGFGLLAPAVSDWSSVVHGEVDLLSFTPAALGVRVAALADGGADLRQSEGTDREEVSEGGGGDGGGGVGVEGAGEGMAA